MPWAMHFAAFWQNNGAVQPVFSNKCVVGEADKWWT